jgi:hypothetical protein
MRYLSIVLLAMLGGGCTPIPTYTGCLPHKLAWTFGPSGDEPYLDVCYVELPYKQLDENFYFVPIDGSHPSTGLPLDGNRDGISDDGRRMSNGQIRWGGGGCREYAMRVTQKGCQGLGDNKQSGGCYYIAVNLQAKQNHAGATVDLTPLWHVRLANGSEQKIPGRTLGSSYQKCP